MAKTLDIWSHYIHISNRARYFFPVNSGSLDWYLPEEGEWEASTYVSPHLYLLTDIFFFFPMLLIGILSAILIPFCLYLFRSFICWHHYLSLKAWLPRLMGNLIYAPLYTICTNSVYLWYKSVQYNFIGLGI